MVTWKMAEPPRCVAFRWPCPCTSRCLRGRCRPTWTAPADGAPPRAATSLRSSSAPPTGCLSIGAESAISMNPEERVDRPTKTSSLSVVTSASRLSSTHSRTWLLAMVSTRSFRMTPMPFSLSIWLYEIHSSSSVSATVSCKKWKTILSFWQTT